MKDTTLRKLIFIYNADSGLRNVILDSAHKIFSPDTYECSLCDITYGIFAENSVWKKFRKDTTLRLEFFHKDEFAKQFASKFGHKFTFPIVLAETTNNLEVIVTTEELNELENVEGLIALLKERSL